MSDETIDLLASWRATDETLERALELQPVNAATMREAHARALEATVRPVLIPGVTHDIDGEEWPPASWEK